MPSTPKTTKTAITAARGSTRPVSRQDVKLAVVRAMKQPTHRKREAILLAIVRDLYGRLETYQDAHPMAES